MISNTYFHKLLLKAAREVYEKGLTFSEFIELRISENNSFDKQVVEHVFINIKEVKDHSQGSFKNVQNWNIQTINTKLEAIRKNPHLIFSSYLRLFEVKKQQEHSYIGDKEMNNLDKYLELSSQWRKGASEALKQSNFSIDYENYIESIFYYEIQETFISHLDRKYLRKYNNQYSTFQKIKWLGETKHLCELFIELKSKGYIDRIDFPSINQSFCKESFHNINEKTFRKYTVPFVDHTPDGAVNGYDQLYSPRYERKFHNILPVKKRPF